MALRNEQLAIHKAILALKLPPNSQLKKSRDEIARHATSALDSLNGKAVAADGAMRTVVQDLNQLADAIPTVPERLTKARRDFQKLFQSQEAIQSAVEQAVRSNETAKHCPPWPMRRFTRWRCFLDSIFPAPNPAERGPRALIAAASDLRDALPSESLASQHWLRREFDRQRIVLEGSVAVDDRVSELARNLKMVVSGMAGLGPRPTAKQLEAPTARAGTRPPDRASRDAARSRFACQ